MYRAKRFSDGKLYALKEANVGNMSAVEKKDAVNEVRLMASIKHDNVVRYHEAILDGKSLLHSSCRRVSSHVHGPVVKDRLRPNAVLEYLF